MVHLKSLAAGCAGAHAMPATREKQKQSICVLSSFHLASTHRALVDFLLYPLKQFSKAAISAHITYTMSAPNPTEPQLQSESVTINNTTSASRSRSTGAGVNTGAGTTRAKTEAELEADRLYEERMEEEYAKREGGA